MILSEEDKERIADGWGKRLMSLGTSNIPCPGSCLYCRGDLPIKYVDDSMRLCFCSPGCAKAWILSEDKKKPWDDELWEFFEDRWYCDKHKMEVKRLRYKSPVVVVDKNWACGCCGRVHDIQDCVRPKPIELSCCGVWFSRHIPMQDC